MKGSDLLDSLLTLFYKTIDFWDIKIIAIASYEA
jgi:hypothetical protein